jgi:hypothetical protein
MDTAQVQAARIEKLSAANTVLTQRLEKASIVTAKVDPAVSEFNNQLKQSDNSAKPVVFDEKNATDEQLKENFAKTKQLQDEFTSADAYVMSVRHPAK